MKPTVGSLFAGIGGIDLGLEWCGFQTKWQVEIDEYARNVLERHFPNAERFSDVREFPPKPDSAWLLHKWRERFYVDLLCGGFPCQDISYAGKGAGLEGERSGLFYEIIRIVRAVGPRFVLLENVSALLTRGLDQVLGTLASIGYDAEWHCIPAASVGAPHIRDRVFIIAYSNSSEQYGANDDSTTHECGWMGSAFPNTIRTEFEPGTGGRGVREGDKELANSTSNRCGQVEQQVCRGAACIGKSCTPGELSEFRRGVEMWWSAEPDVGRVVNGVSEVLDSDGRISTQPTPKDKTAARIHRLRGLGNAVVPQVAEFAGRRVMQLMSGIDRV